MYCRFLSLLYCYILNDYSPRDLELTIPTEYGIADLLKNYLMISRLGRHKTDYGGLVDWRSTVMSRL